MVLSGGTAGESWGREPKAKKSLYYPVKDVVKEGVGAGEKLAAEPQSEVETAEIESRRAAWGP